MPMRSGLFFQTVQLDEITRKESLERLEDQIGWYDKKSASNQSWLKRIKIIELMAASLIPLLAGFSTTSPQYTTCYAVITGGLGTLIVLLESVQGLYQFPSNWISYRSSCEGLRHEKYLWLAKAGHYADAKEPDRLLAERVESIASNEHAKWVSAQEKVDKKEKEHIVEK